MLETMLSIRITKGILKGTWAKQTTSGGPPTPRSQAGAAVANGLIFTGYGWGSSSYIPRDWWSYNIASHVWTSLSVNDQPWSRSCGQIVTTLGPNYTADDSIYFLAGNGNGTFEAYSITGFYHTKDTWTTLTSGPPARYFATMATIAGKIYLYGGQNNSGVGLIDFWVYDTSVGTWTQLTSGPPGGSLGAMAAVGNKLYYFGTAGDLWIYSTVSNTWQKIPIPTYGPSARYGQSVAAIGNLIYMFGGIVNGVASTELWAYDTVKNLWSLATNTGPQAGYSGALVTDGTKLYYLFGSSSAGPTSDVWCYTP